MSREGKGTSVAVHFIDPTPGDAQLFPQPAYAAITEPVSFSMLDGIDEDGSWSVTARFNDINVRGGRAPNPNPNLPGRSEPYFPAIFNFQGDLEPDGDPTGGEITTAMDNLWTVSAIDPSNLGGHSITGDDTFIALARAGATGPTGASNNSNFTFTVQGPADMPLHRLTLIARSTGPVPTGMFVRSSADGFVARLPQITGEFTAPPSTSDALNMSTAYRTYIFDLSGIARTNTPVSFAVSVFSPQPEVHGIEIQTMTITALNPFRNLIGIPVRIHIGNPANDILTGTRDDAMYGIVEEYVWSGIGTDNFDPLVTIRGRGLRSALEGQIVAPAPNQPRQTSRVFTNTNPGSIWTTLRAEAIARGNNFWPTPRFSGTQDAAGQPWSRNVSMSIQVGTTMNDVLRAFSELGFEVTVERDQLCVYDERAGRGSPDDPHFTMLDHDDMEQQHIGPIRNAALARAANGTLQEIRSSFSMATSGRKETYIEAQRTESVQLAQAALSKLDQEGIKLTITHPYITPQKLGNREVGTTPRPYFEYKLGDWADIGSLFFAGRAPARRVISIAITMDQEGRMRVTPELGDVRDDLDRATRKILSKLNSGTGEGAAVEFRDTVGSTASIAPATAVDGSTGIQGTLLGDTIRTVDTIVSYDPGTNLAQTTTGLTVGNYTNGFLQPGDEVYIVNGEAAVGVKPAPGS